MNSASALCTDNRTDWYMHTNCCCCCCQCTAVACEWKIAKANSSREGSKASSDALVRCSSRQNSFRFCTLFGWRSKSKRTTTDSTLVQFVFDNVQMRIIELVNTFATRNDVRLQRIIETLRAIHFYFAIVVLRQQKHRANAQIHSRKLIIRFSLCQWRIKSKNNKKKICQKLSHRGDTGKMSYDNFSMNICWILSVERANSRFGKWTNSRMTHTSAYRHEHICIFILLFTSLVETIVQCNNAHKRFKLCMNRVHILDCSFNI